jgi:F-type H+-transporting ATPase subunit alpha
MKQKQYSPLPIAEMGISLFAANEGFIDDVEVDKVVDFEEAMHAYMRSNCADLIAKINEKGDYNDDIAGEIRAGIEKFKASSTW